MTTPNDPLAEARRERQRLFERMVWWETHRLEALFPIAIVFFGAGYGLGYLARRSLGGPEHLAEICAIAMLFLANVFITRYFSMAHVDRADARIARLEREHRR